LPMNDLTLIKSLVDLGCTVVICALIVVVIYKLSIRFGVAFIATQEKIAEAMAQQALSMTGMSAAIQTYIQRDNNDHREILLAVQVVGQELKWLRDEVRTAKEEAARIGSLEKTLKMVHSQKPIAAEGDE